ncbi:MAG: DUF1592 domain-containing protein [Deltaproteobacteria bacterium]|nr:DUF1592 domain-containing protein [Deltaproteobacteria bacterium]
MDDYEGPQRLPPGAADAGDDSDGDGGEIEGQCEGEQGGSIIRRMTTIEYANTVLDTLGVEILADVQAILPADLRSDGFSNQTAGLLVTYGHIEGYHDLAELIVARLPDPTGLVDTYADCTDFSDACEVSLITNLGLRVWRRPLVAEEIASFRPIFATANEEGDDFTVGAGFVLEAMLQAPQFIYRLEDELPSTDDGPEGLRQLGDYEIASRLSYLLWSSSPDDALFDAAADEALHTTDQIEQQVQRMLAMPRARETAMRYIEDWLALEGLPSINRDPALYPDFDLQLAQDMREETLRVAEELLWEDGAPFSSLLTADFTWATPELAALYGIPNPGPGWQRYSLADVPHRSGMLTHAGIQAINGHGNRPSIVERGLFILGGVLCSTVAAPPAELDTSMADLEEGQSPRYYSEARLDNVTCRACHEQFDTMGWAFESFDGIGAWRTHDELGNALKQDGMLFVPGSGETVPFDTVEQFADVIAEEPQVETCIGVRKPLQFAWGRPLGPADVCARDEIADVAAESGGSYRALVSAIATHPSFRLIRATE